MKYTVLLGRILFSLIFVTGGISNFSKQAIEHAAAQGIPLAAIAVPLAGMIALLGGLSIALGYILVSGYFYSVIASVSQRSNPLKIKRLLRPAEKRGTRNDYNFNPKRV